MPLEGTLLARVVADGAPIRIDDVEREQVPEVSRRILAAGAFRAVVFVPLVCGGQVLGAVVLAANRPRAFTDADVETIAELGRPLALGIEQWRLAEESRRRTDELAALHATSQLITARLDVASVLDRISLSVPALIGASGCGIGLFNNERTHARPGGRSRRSERGVAHALGAGRRGDHRPRGGRGRRDPRRRRADRRALGPARGGRARRDPRAAVRPAAGRGRRHRRDLGLLDAAGRASRRITSASWKRSPSTRASRSTARGSSMRACAARARRALSSRPAAPSPRASTSAEPSG